jgi:heptaprenyl diphosphate synthase
MVGVKTRFLAGMLMLPPFLFVGSLPVKAALTAFFAVLALLAGKRLRWGYFLILAASVTFFHLLSPWGRVLLEIGPLTVTAGSLEGGLIRSATLIGMVFLSVAAVRPELELPGRLGGLLGRTFYYFDLIIEGKNRLSRKDFFRSLDELLMERFDPNREDLSHAGSGSAGSDEVEGAGAGRQITVGISPARSRVAAASAVLVPWVMWIWTLIVRP